MNYDLNDKLTVSVEATNLLDPVTRNHCGDASRCPREVGGVERTLSLGLRFRF